MPRAARGLAPFLAASAAIHVCMLAIGDAPTRPAVPVGSTLQVDPGRPWASARPGRVTGAGQTATGNVREPPAPAGTVAGGGVAAGSPVPDLPADTTAEAGSVGIALTPRGADAPANHLLGELETRLARYLSYPPLARRRGWQGTVLLAIVIEPDGQFEGVQVARSSGYDLLDRSALEALQRLGRAPELRSLAGGSAATQLSVIYRLIGNR
jgi:protein TonB